MIDTETKDELTEAEALEELEARRTKLRKWHEDEANFSREAQAARQQRQALEDEERRLVMRDPELITGDNEPTTKTNAVAKVRAELAKAPDPDAATRRRDHAAAVVRKLSLELEDFVRENFDQLHRARLEEAERVRADVRGGREAFITAAERYLAFARESLALTAPHADYTGRDIAGIDEVSDLVRVLERLEDLPLPTVHGKGEELGQESQPVFFERPTEEDGDQ